MLFLDLNICALQIQQTVGNTNWIDRAGVLHIVIAALHALGKTNDGSGFDTCAIHLCSSPWNLWLQCIQARNRMPHHNQPSNHNDAI